MLRRRGLSFARQEEPRDEIFPAETHEADERPAEPPWQGV